VNSNSLTELPQGCAPSGCHLDNKYVNIRNIKPVLLSLAGQLGLAALHLTGRPLVITAGYADGCELEVEHAAGIAVDFSLAGQNCSQRPAILTMAYVLAEKYPVCIGIRFDRMNRMLLHVNLRA
jgi:hypothetical protein